MEGESDDSNIDVEEEWESKPTDDEEQIQMVMEQADKTEKQMTDMECTCYSSERLPCVAHKVCSLK